MMLCYENVDARDIRREDALRAIPPA
jgi:hypothetical protein